MLEVLIFVLLAGCIAEPGKQEVAQTTEYVPTGSVPVISRSETNTSAAVQPSFKPSVTLQKQYEKAQPEENYSEAVEVDYREYVDWFMSYNINIRGYTPEEYVCGQYTVDMIKASEKAGFKAYFGSIMFSDGTGHALVAFKSTFSGYTSWYWLF